MESDIYSTIAQPGESIYKEKGSKFIGYCFHSKTEDEVKAILDDIHKQHHQARHVCYAYILDTEGKVFRANDDGEPSNSAGMPILGQIRSAELSQTFIAVVRYFGGVKLGVGGLIQAYKAAAQEAVSNAKIEQRFITDSAAVQVPFDLVNEVMRILKGDDIKITDQAYDPTSCTVYFEARKSQFQQLIDQLSLIHQAKLIGID